MRNKKAYQKKAERLEILILDFTKWLDSNYKTATIQEVKAYWKKLVENYVFEGVRKVIEALGNIEIKEEGVKE